MHRGGDAREVEADPAAAVTADPGTGTIPTGYLILNVTQGTLKRHAGGYSWETIVGATGGKIGFYEATPVVQPSGADQVAVTLGNTDGEISGLTVSDPPTQAEVQALRDACEELASDVRNLSTLIHSRRAALGDEHIVMVLGPVKPGEVSDFFPCFHGCRFLSWGRGIRPSRCKR